MTTAVNDAQLTALLGRQWTDDKGRTWEVKRLSNYEGKVRAIMAKSGRGKDMTVDEVLAEIANDEGDGATNTQPFAPYDNLIGKGWTTDTGEVWTITGSIVENGEDVIVAVDGAGFEGHFNPTDIMAAVDPEAVGDDQVVIPDAPLADAGAEADEQYRQRSLAPDGAKKKLPKLPEHVVEKFEELMARMYFEAERYQSPAHVTLKWSIKPGQEPREFDTKYQVKPTPPTIKDDDCFWAGTEIIPGVPKRDSDDQLTIIDAEHQAGEDPAELQAADNHDPSDTADAAVPA